MITIGIDEAGRGSIIGPLPVGGVGLTEDEAALLKKAGVKDSKLLSIKNIFKLERLIKEVTSNFMVLVLDPTEIDNRFKSEKNLNTLELDHMSEIANSLKGEKVIVDSPSANTKKVRSYLMQRIKDKEVIAENYADKNHVEVGAASILAKSMRERKVAEIVKELEYDFGSGYPSDPRTIKFLKLLKTTGKLDDEKYSKYIRKTWMTFKNLKNSDLNDF